MWFAVRMLHRCEVEGLVEEAPLHDETITLVDCAEEDAARERAERIGREREHEYVGGTGRIVRWRFVGVTDVVECMDPPGDGAEVWYDLRRLDASGVEHPLLDDEDVRELQARADRRAPAAPQGPGGGDRAGP